MELKLHDITYSEDTIEVYELGGSKDLVFYTTEKIGRRTVNTHIRLGEAEQIKLYKALDKHLYYDEWDEHVEGLEPCNNDKVMIDAVELRDKIKRDLSKGLTAQEIVCYLNGYIKGKTND